MYRPSRSLCMKLEPKNMHTIQVSFRVIPFPAQFSQIFGLRELTSAHGINPLTGIYKACRHVQQRDDRESGNYLLLFAERTV